MFFKQHYWKNWIKKHQCKLANGISAMHKNTVLIMEEYVEMGHVTIRSPNVTIGAFTYIRSGSQLFFVSSIGRFCSIANNVSIGNPKQVHPINWVSSHPFQYTNNNGLSYNPDITNTQIGHDVWIGENATILEGITIGTGAIIATNATVTKDIPPYAVVAGNPAKIIKFRHPEHICRKLLDSQWWEYPTTFLKTLSLDNPEKFLIQLETTPLNKTIYKKIKITDSICKEL